MQHDRGYHTPKTLSKIAKDEGGDKNRYRPLGRMVNKMDRNKKQRGQQIGYREVAAKVSMGHMVSQIA